MESLSNRIALVTGGSRGVGRAIALSLAEAGAVVAVNYRREVGAAADVVDEVERRGGRAKAYQAAIGDLDAMKDMIKAITADLGSVDLLVSNAGTASRGKAIADTDADEYVRLLTVHALGPLALIRELLPSMRKSPRSDVIVVSSAVVPDAPAYGAPYTMAKAAIEAAARTLAKEEQKFGIRVNIVAPGLVATDMGGRLVAATANGASIEDLDSSYPFGRVARPEDVAGIVRFLVTDGASYVSGQRIAVDGGGTDRGIVARTGEPGAGH